ncbi:antitoxin component YwqK of YwqJK toxin-antitoxin module [Breznakibacter xylanolyticus]|uniref:Antitoxin component YwqK of YwqJK toxin-antitoxin module n=1 Tax=Breznakibacter xylanolyticus TaxID=990 RepID=A0A2W7P4N8_9BACT|nr:hypothetical protein [Breznakibacter xylanolyticus]PZX20316.1 antitoxin component YwqK of YwqJK toxin-antitoxin module [Breznakibacter xylanolyticus]
MKFVLTRLVVLCMALLPFSLFAQHEIEYFNDNWEPCAKAEASFYRPRPEFVDSGYIVRDYYINTTQLQGVGFSKTGGDKDFNGQVSWYHPNGELMQQAVLVDGVFHGLISTYDEAGNLLASGIFQDGEAFDGSFSHDHGGYYLLTHMVQGTIKRFEMIDALGETSARIEGEVDEAGDFVRVDYYDANGEFMGSGKNISSYLIAADGITVGYYFYPMRVAFVARRVGGAYDGPVTFYYSTGQPKCLEYYLPEQEGDGYQLKSAAVYFDKYGKRIDSLAYMDHYPYEGVEYRFFSSDTCTVNDQIESITPYFEGRLHGLVQTFDQQGHLVSKTVYVNGDIVGDKVVFDPAGNVKYRLTYREGSPWEGTSMEYGILYEYAQGNVVSEKSFYSGGDQKIFTTHRNGVKTSIYYAKNGAEMGQLVIDADYNYSGTEYQFDDDEVSSVTVYVNGHESEIKRFYQGKMMLHNVTNGTSTYMDPKSGETVTCLYQDSSPVEGTVFEFSYSYDYLLSRCSYKNGKLNGAYTYYEYDYDLDSVLVKKEEFYVDGELNGMTKQYDRGVLIQTQTYVQGMLNGETVNYSDGEVVARVEYRDGQPWSGTVMTLDYYNDLESMATYVEGNLEGEKIYYSDGEVTNREHYTAGVINQATTYVDFLTDSVLVLNYVDGEPFDGKIYLSGAIDTYHKGELISSETYGGIAGTFIVKRRGYVGDRCTETLCYDNGLVKEVRHFVGDVLQGESKAYDTKGKLLANGVYADGLPAYGSFVFFHNDLENDYWKMTLSKKLIIATKMVDGSAVEKLNSERVDKNQAQAEWIRNFLSMLSEKDYNYDFPSNDSAYDEYY